MFQDVALGSVGFKSRCTKKTASVASLTDAVATAESSTEPLFGFVDNATQTEPNAASASGASAKDKGVKSSAESKEEEEETSAIAFVRRVGPAMLSEMATNATTSGYFRGLLASRATTAPRRLFRPSAETVPHVLAVAAMLSCGGCTVGFEKYLEESAEKTVSKLFLLKFDYDAYFQAPQTQSTGGCSWVRT